MIRERTRDIGFETEEQLRKLIGMAFQRHLAFPNHPDRTLGEDKDAKMIYRFYASDGHHFCINPDEKSVGKFISFLESQGVSSTEFTENFYAELSDISWNGHTIAQNRGWLDFRMRSKDDKRQHEISFGTYYADLRQLVVAD